ncbi:MAG: sigma-54-dependent Fis family transcriptional regulator [Deltaproteobacteria bacterium]|nr:sigma-54-dependent Fis family transcriptional regulator [Deltaproteobacteria bacterium]
MRTVVLEPVLDVNPIVIVDGDGTVLDSNLAWTKLISLRRKTGLRTSLFDVVAFVGASGAPTAASHRGLQVHHVALQGLEDDSPLVGSITTAVLIPIVHRRRDTYLCVLLSPRLFHPDAVRFSELLAMDATTSARHDAGLEAQALDGGATPELDVSELALPIEVEGSLRAASRLVAAVAGPAACPLAELVSVLGERLREGVPSRRILVAVRDTERLGMPSGLLTVPAEADAEPVWRPLANWPAGVGWARSSIPPAEVADGAREAVLGELPAWVQREFAGAFPVDIAPRFVVAEPCAAGARGLVAAGPWRGTEVLVPDERLLVELAALLFGHRLRTAERDQLRQAEAERLAHALRAERTALGRTADRLEPVALSAAMAAVVERGRALESLGRPYAIVGPGGAGRRTLARYLTAVGPRRDAPLVELSCRFHDEPWLREELFGERATGGADPGGLGPGKLELAVGGTLMVGDLDQLPRALQGELLARLTRPRADGAAPPLLVATLEETPERAAQAGRLHPDLAGLFGARVTTVPALAERLEDVPALAARFVEAAAAELGRPAPELTARAMDRLRARVWPGHVRELKAAIEGAVALVRGGVLDADLLPVDEAGAAGAVAAGAPPPAIDLSQSFAELKQQWVDHFERAYIDAALRRSAGNLSAAARLARMDKKNFHAKAVRFGLAGSAPATRNGVRSGALKGAGRRRTMPPPPAGEAGDDE